MTDERLMTEEEIEQSLPDCLEAEFNRMYGEGFSHGSYVLAAEGPNGNAIVIGALRVPATVGEETQTKVRNMLDQVAKSTGAFLDKELH